MFDPKSDYALNKKDPSAIVYIDAFGTLTRLTPADFSGPEEFQRWKAWSECRDSNPGPLGPEDWTENSRGAFGRIWCWLLRKRLLSGPLPSPVSVRSRRGMGRRLGQVQLASAVTALVTTAPRRNLSKQGYRSRQCPKGCCDLYFHSCELPSFSCP